MDTGISYDENGVAWFFSDQRRFINQIHRLKEEHPDQVEILNEPETNDGSIYAKIPAEWFCIRVPVKRELSDEQRQVIADRLKAYRESAKNPRNL